MEMTIIGKCLVLLSITVRSIHTSSLPSLPVDKLHHHPVIDFSQPHLSPPLHTPASKGNEASHLAVSVNNKIQQNVLQHSSSDATAAPYYFGVKYPPGPAAVVVRSDAHLHGYTLSPFKVVVKDDATANATPIHLHPNFSKSSVTTLPHKTPYNSLSIQHVSSPLRTVHDPYLSSLLSVRKPVHFGSHPLGHPIVHKDITVGKSIYQLSSGSDAAHHTADIKLISGAGYIPEVTSHSGPHHEGRTSGNSVSALDVSVTKLASNPNHPPIGTPVTNLNFNFVNKAPDVDHTPNSNPTAIKNLQSVKSVEDVIYPFNPTAYVNYHHPINPIQDGITSHPLSIISNFQDSRLSPIGKDLPNVSQPVYFPPIAHQPVGITTDAQRIYFSPRSPLSSPGSKTSIVHINTSSAEKHNSGIDKDFYGERYKDGTITSSGHQYQDDKTKQRDHQLGAQKLVGVKTTIHIDNHPEIFGDFVREVRLSFPKSSPLATKPHSFLNQANARTHVVRIRYIPAESSVNPYETNKKTNPLSTRIYTVSKA